MSQTTNFILFVFNHITFTNQNPMHLREECGDPTLQGSSLPIIIRGINITYANINSHVTHGDPIHPIPVHLGSTKMATPPLP